MDEKGSEDKSYTRHTKYQKHSLYQPTVANNALPTEGDLHAMGNSDLDLSVPDYRNARLDT